MDCLKDGFAQKGKFKKILLTDRQIRVIKIALTNEYTSMADEVNYFPEHKEDMKIMDQIFNKL
jgi:hypothetical protein